MREEHIKNYIIKAKAEFQTLKPIYENAKHQKSDSVIAAEILNILSLLCASLDNSFHDIVEFVVIPNLNPITDAAQIAEMKDERFDIHFPYIQDKITNFRTTNFPTKGQTPLTGFKYIDIIFKANKNVYDLLEAMQKFNIDNGVFELFKARNKVIHKENFQLMSITSSITAGKPQITTDKFKIINGYKVNNSTESTWITGDGSSIEGLTIMNSEKLVIHDFVTPHLTIIGSTDIKIINVYLQSISWIDSSGIMSYNTINGHMQENIVTIDRNKGITFEEAESITTNGVLQYNAAADIEKYVLYNTITSSKYFFKINPHIELIDILEQSLNKVENFINKLYEEI